MPRLFLAFFSVCASGLLTSVGLRSEDSISLKLQQSQLEDHIPSLITDADEMFDRSSREIDAIYASFTTPSSCDDCRQCQLLPDGLLWHSYLAAPQEPRISTVVFHDSHDGVFWDATLGGRVGLVRYGTLGAKNPQGWQWDVEGAAITRLDLLHAEDVESMDYRFGTELTAAEGPWAMKLGYFHISSHVGDEYMIRNPSFKRINYVTESWIFGVRYRAWDALRLYGEIADAFRASGGAKRLQFQTGIEYTPVALRPPWGAPFAAINWDFRQCVNYDVTTTAQVGWLFRGPTSDRTLRLGLQYGSGPTSQFSFFTRREEYIGLGAWFDY